MTTPAVTPDRAAEGEAIERAALASLHGVATAALRQALGLDWLTGPEGALSMAAALPASAIVVNRAFLAGGAPEVAAAVAARYRAARIARFFLHQPPGAVPGAPGLAPARAWQKFLRLRGAALPEAAEVRIDPVRPGPDAAAAARLVCAAFDLGAAAEPWLARLCTDPRWQVFLARVDGEPAATGALFVQDGIGWTDWGATAPGFRGRGLQRALLCHRLRLADAMGIARLHTCTGAPAPGDPQHSYSNILRCGFVETRLRGNLAPPAVG